MLDRDECLGAGLNDQRGRRGSAFLLALSEDVVVDAGLDVEGGRGEHVEEDALTASDYAPVQGFVLAMGALFVLLNLLVDVLYLMYCYIINTPFICSRQVKIKIMM